MRRGQLYGDWDKLEKDLKKMQPLLDANMEKATKYNAMSLRDEIKRRIRSGKGMVALKKATIERKGSSKPLIEHGDLLNAVTYKTLGKISFFIGVPRTAKRKRAMKLAGNRGAVSKTELVNIAAVHEFGAPSRNIPARPYVRPSIQRSWKGMVAVWKRSLRDTLRGRIFKPVTRTRPGKR